MSKPALPPTDLRHVVLDQHGYRCAFCESPNRAQLRLDRIVPESYGGPEELWNLWALCRKCARLRHQMKHSSKVPPDPEGLQRVLAFPHLRQAVFRVLKQAAEHALDEQYDSVTAALCLGRLVDDIVGWHFKDATKPDTVSSDDWKWLCSTEAWGAVYWAAYALLPDEGRGGVWRRCPWGPNGRTK